MTGGRVFRDPGQLSHRFVLEALSEQSDGFGTLTETWAEVADVWGALRPLTAKVRLLAQQRDEETTHRVILRFRTDVASGWRLRMGYRHFRIETVIDPDETRRYLELTCVEEGR
ncbi:MAG: phage head closure protein [Pseudomonadota bacterium]